MSYAASPRMTTRQQMRTMKSSKSVIGLKNTNSFFGEFANSSDRKKDEEREIQLSIEKIERKHEKAIRLKNNLIGSTASKIREINTSKVQSWSNF